MADAVPERKSPIKRSYDCLPNYNHGSFVVLDKLDQRIAKVQLPINLQPLPRSASEGLEFGEDGLLFMSKRSMEVSSPAPSTRYNFTVMPEEPAAKRKKVSHDDEEGSGSSSSSDPPEALSAAVVIDPEKLAKLYGDFLPKPAEPIPVADDPVLGDDDYEPVVEKVAEGGRPKRTPKDIDRYVDEDQKDLDDESPTKKKTSKKAKQSVLLRDVKKFYTLEARRFSILNNPENIRRSKLSRKDGLKVPRPPSALRLPTCDFTNINNHLAWKVWRFFFTQAALTALAFRSQCRHLLGGVLEYRKDYSGIMDGWTEAARIEFNKVSPKLPVCAIPEETEVPACSILQIVEFYRFIQFRSMPEADQHLVRFRAGLQVDIPYSREFQVTSSTLAQILQLHAIFEPTQMMLDMAMKGLFATDLEFLSRVARLTYFKQNSDALLSKAETPLSTKVTALAKHAFDLWWFNQTIFEITVAEGIISERESGTLLQSSTPTAGDRRGLGF